MTQARALTAGETLGGRPFPEPGVGPRYAPDRACRVVAIDVGLAIDPSNPGLQGDTTVTVEPLPAADFAVRLDLGEVTVRSVETPEGTPLQWTHDGTTLEVSGLPDTGGAVRVRYDGQPSRGLYFTGPTSYAPDRLPMAWTQCQDEDGHHLFPCHDHPGQRARYTLRITAPAGQTVVSNGVLVEKLDGGDQVTWVWEQREPIPAYLVVVCVGEFDLFEDEASTIGGAGTLPLRAWVPAGADLDRVAQIFAKTPAMIAAFEAAFGVAYPWPRYDQVVVHEFIFGGMENVACTVLTDRSLTDARAGIDHSADDLIAHELAHQWFGDLVTCADWSQAWLNEGWATYSEYVWELADKGLDDAVYVLWSKLGGYLGEDAGRYQRSITHYRFRNPIDLFDRHLYQKGGLVLHTLRAALGDGPFWSGVTAYLRRHAHGPVHTRDFQRVLEETTGRNLDGFFQQFVHGAGHPALEVSIDHADGLLNIGVKQTQSGPSVADVFEVPLAIRLVWGEGDAARVQDVRLPLNQRERSFSLPLADAAPPDRVEVDPHLTVLADVKIKAARTWLEASLRGDSGVAGRIRAGKALGEDKGPAAGRALAAALGADPFWGVRVELAGVLAARGDDLAREALLTALEDPHPKVRAAVANALGAFDHADVTAALDGRAREDGDASLRVVAAALHSLGKLRAPTAVERCRAILADEAEAARSGAEAWGSTLRVAALDGLGATRDVTVLADLLAHSGPEHSPHVRAAAARGLGQLAEEVVDARRGAADRLMSLARSGPFRVRLTAISALGRAGDPRAAGVLRQIHQGDPDGRTARTAYEAGKRLAMADLSGHAEVARLRDVIQELREENRSLRSRLDRIEARLDAADAAEGAPGAD